MRAQIFLLCSALAALADPAALEELDGEWFAWKEYHGKVYGNDYEEQARKGVWKENYQLVEKHNSANLSYTLEMNSFADMVWYIHCLQSRPNLFTNNKDILSNSFKLPVYHQARHYSYVCKANLLPFRLPCCTAVNMCNSQPIMSGRLRD